MATPLISHEQNLIITGMSMGLLHVLAGPDHLSALAALAVGTSWKAFMLGFRWGIGHSSGLVVVAVVFISLKGNLDLRKLGRYCDFIVGLFMITLGCYGVIGALKMYKQKRNKRDADLEAQRRDSKLPSVFGNRITKPDSFHDGLHNVSHTQHGHSIGSNISGGSSGGSSCIAGKPVNYGGGTGAGGITTVSPDVQRPNVSTLGGGDHESFSEGGLDATSSSHLYPIAHHEFEHGHHFDAEDCPWCPFIDRHDPTTQKVVSFSIGLLHGVAGPGAILGVLPAIEMQNAKSSVLYLGSFIITSTLSMGTFAALYGEATRRLGATAESIELALSVFSAAMSIVVGATWLVLSVLGKLEDFFH